MRAQMSNVFQLVLIVMVLSACQTTATTTPTTFVSKCIDAAICFDEKKRGDLIQIVGRNISPQPLTVGFLGSSQNMSAHLQAASIVMAPGAENIFFEAAPPVRGAWSYSYRYHWHVGTISKAHDDRETYRLPFPAGSPVRLLQGYNGSYTHFGPLRYSIDWAMPEGTPVLAARGGTVIWTRDEEDRTGAPSRGNFILIEHADGTVGHYLHFKLGGVLVTVGQTVSAGDRIGLSGNTGKSTQPHLHFMSPRQRRARVQVLRPSRPNFRHRPGQR